jgi:glycosyltransferase 2 family protein
VVQSATNMAASDDAASGWTVEARGPLVSYVVPAHNSANVIEDTLEALRRRLADLPAEIIVVENGSSDGTAGLLSDVASTWPADAPVLRVVSSERGLGHALRAGIVASTGRSVILGSDDLAFGFDELDVAERLGFPPDRVVIGSKAHPDSVVARAFLRTVLTGGLLLLRRAILNLNIGDTQGTYVLNGDWARGVASALGETGFLLSTEVAYAAHLGGLRLTEVPVHLRESNHPTRIRLGDVSDMMLGLVTLRRRRDRLRTASRASLPTPGPAVAPAGRAPLGRLAFPVLRVLFTFAVVGAVIYAAGRQWADVSHLLTSLAWHSVLLSVLMVLAGLAAQTMAWKAALRDVGYLVSVRTTAQIYLIGLLAKYLPGSIWSFLVQMELGRRASIPRPRVFVASILAVALSTAAALLLGVFGLPALFDVDRRLAVAVVVLTPIGLFCAHPRVLTWLVRQLLRLLHRPPLDEPITWRGVALITLWSAVGWTCFGIHLWLLANAGATPGVSGVVACIGAISLGITGGMVVFLSPSGLGVREAVITAALLPYMSPGAALGMALVCRLIFTVAELLAAILAALANVNAFWPRPAGAGTQVADSEVVQVVDERTPSAV